MSAAAVGAEAGMSAAVVARMIRGAERPSPRLMRAVERLTGEPREALFPERDPLVDAVAAVVALAPPLTLEQRARLRALLAAP